MLLPQGPVGYTPSTRQAGSVLLLIGLLAGWFMSPGDHVDHGASNAVSDLVRYWAYHPQLTFPPACDDLADLDMMETYAAQARAAIAAKTAPPQSEGTQGALDALCEAALSARERIGWRKYAVAGGESPSTTWLTYVAMHETWLMLAFNLGLLFLMAAPFLEIAWGPAVMVSFFFLVTLFGAAVQALFGGHETLLHGASTLLAGGVGAYVARSHSQPFQYEMKIGRKWTIEAPAWTLLGYWLFKELIFAVLGYHDQRFWVDAACLVFGAAVATYLKVSGLEAKLSGGVDDEPVAPDPVESADDGEAIKRETMQVGSETLHTPLGFAPPTDAPSMLWSWDSSKRTGAAASQDRAAASNYQWSSNEEVRATRIDANQRPVSLDDNAPDQDDDPAKSPQNRDESDAETLIDTSLESMLAELAPTPDNSGLVDKDTIPEKDGADVQDVLPTQVFEGPPDELLKRTGSPEKAVAKVVKPPPLKQPLKDKPSTIPPQAEEVVALPQRHVSRKATDRDLLAALDQAAGVMPEPEKSREPASNTQPLAKSLSPTTPTPGAIPASGVPKPSPPAKAALVPLTREVGPNAPKGLPQTIVADVVHCRVVGRDRKTWHLQAATGEEISIDVADVAAIAIGMCQLYKPPVGEPTNALVTDIVVKDSRGTGTIHRVPVHAFDFDRLMPGTDRRTAWQKLVRELAESSGAATLPVDPTWPGPPFTGHRDEAGFEAEIYDFVQL